MQLQPDTIINGRYRLERLIGEGGMGMVWAAVDEEGRERVALKLLKEDGKKNELLLRRFAREARAAMAVAHPNVVRIREVITTEENDPVIVMDYLQGESLAARLERVHRLPLKDFAELFVGVISAIGTAHAAGIVHRDLKPDNIFLVSLPDGREEARVVDFGIAKLTALDGEAKQTGGLTTTGAVLGTPYYMSPEQVFGDKNIDHRSDIWSLGLIVFEALAGYRAVEGENIGQLLKVITTGAIPRLREAVPNLPEDVLELDERMISPDRMKRPYDLREVLNVFRRHATRQAASFGEATIPGDFQMLRDIHPALARVAEVSPTAETLAGPPILSAESLAKKPNSTTAGAAVSSAAPASVEGPRRRPLIAWLAAAAVFVGVAGVGVVSYKSAAHGGSNTGNASPVDRPLGPSAAPVMPGEPAPRPSASVASAPSASASASAVAVAKAVPPVLKPIGPKPGVPAKENGGASVTTTTGTAITASATTTAAAPATTTTGGLQGAVGQENPYNKK